MVIVAVALVDLNNDHFHSHCKISKIIHQFHRLKVANIVSLTLPCCRRDMSCDCKHESVVHDLAALVAGAESEAVVVDDNVIVSVDNNIHFDCDCHPNDMKNVHFSKNQYKQWRYFTKIML